jgi:hypothetical protein
LPDGQVLVAWGVAAVGELSSAMLYDRSLGFDPTWRPLISSALANVKPNSAITLTGSRFTGISEASDGGTNQSATNYPLVQLRRIDNKAIEYLQPNAAGWSDTRFVSTPITSFQNGPALLTVITNGIPSVSKFMMMGYAGKPVKALPCILLLLLDE